MAKYGHAAIGGAEHLARIHGTEEDKVNCPFYYKIGACRHGDKCSRQHHRPAFSQTILIKQMYTNPYFAATSAGGMISSLNKARVQLDFDEFYEEVYEELRKHGSLEGLYVCDNVGDHMVGNVYAKFEDEEFAEAALKQMHGRYYAGKQLYVEYSPVTDFTEARCRQYDECECDRGGFCNFMHVKRPCKKLDSYLWDEFKFRNPAQKGTAAMNSMRMNRRDDRRDRDHPYGPPGGGGRGRGDRDYGRDRYDRRDRRDRSRSPPMRRDRRDRPRDEPSRDRRRDRRDRDRSRSRSRSRERHRRHRSPSPPPTSM